MTLPYEANSNFAKGLQAPAAIAPPARWALSVSNPAARDSARNGNFSTISLGRSDCEAEEEVEPVVGAWLYHREPMVEHQGQDGERMVVYRDRPHEYVANVGTDAGGVLGYVEHIVPLAEAIVEAGKIDVEREE